MPETTETHVVTDLPNKKSTLRDRLSKKTDTPTDNADTAPKRVLSNVKKGALVLAAGGVAVVVASKLAKRSVENAETEVQDAPSTDN